MWIVTSHQYTISALVSQTSFCQETSVGLMKYSWAVLSGYHPNQPVLTVHTYSCFVEYPFNFLFLIILLQTFAFVDFGCLKCFRFSGISSNVAAYNFSWNPCLPYSLSQSKDACIDVAVSPKILVR